MKNNPIGDILTAREHLMCYLFLLENQGYKDTNLAHRIRDMILWIELSTAASDNINYSDPNILKVSNVLLQECCDTYT